MNRTILMVIFALVVYTGIVFLTDVRDVGDALSSMDLYWIPLFLSLSMLNYALRFLKFNYFLHRVDVRLPWRESLGYFLSGFSMTVSPGKLGELLKCYLIRERRNVPLSRTSPVVVAERLTDLLSMIIIALMGLMMIHHRGAMIAVLAGIVLVSIVLTLLLWERAYCFITGLACRIRVLSRYRESLEGFGIHCRVLLDTRSLLVSVPLGVLSWGAEAMVLCLVSISLGISPPLSVGLALLAHSAGSIAGAVSMIPGGLGLTEITIGAILTLSMSQADAAATTLIMRFATLWFAVVLGFAVLGPVKRKAGAEKPPPR